MQASAFPQMNDQNSDPWKPVPIPELDPKEASKNTYIFSILVDRNISL